MSIFIFIHYYVDLHNILLKFVGTASSGLVWVMVSNDDYIMCVRAMNVLHIILQLVVPTNLPPYYYMGYRLIIMTSFTGR